LDLHENEPVGRSHCYMADFGLVLAQRQKVTRKWPIVFYTNLKLSI